MVYLNNTLEKEMASLISSPQINLPEANFKEKVRCGEVYRNLNGNEMFQKFYYRCLECSMDFESSPEFEEHVIAHYLQDDDDCAAVHNFKNNENVISLSSDEDDEEEEENGYLYAFEVASLVEENVSENDLPLPLMQMLSEHSDSCDQTIQLSEESDDDDDRNVVFPCEGLRKQALHQYSEHCCTQCPAYFSTKSELNFHLHVHMLPNTVVCSHCYEAFPNVLKLNEHISLNKRKRLRKSKNKGDIDCDKMKSYLPSLSNLNQKEDVKKWENLIKERNDLRGKNCKRAKEDVSLQQNKVEKIEEEKQRCTDLSKDINKDNLESSEKCGENVTTDVSMNVSTNCETNNSKEFDQNMLNNT